MLPNFLRRSPVLWLLVALAAVEAAGAPADGPQQRTARDQVAARQPPGTASITGHVLSAETGRPVARARVTASADELPDGNASTLTDASGTYTISSLPAGTYSITAAKSVYLTMAYGARRPQRPGRRVKVDRGQQVREIDVRLPRGSVIAGRVYDESGEAIVRANVQALRYQYLQGEARLAASGSAQTDDRGQFRIFGLNPGSYVVTAEARLDRPGGEDGRPPDPAFAQSYAPTYYPGVTNPTDAGTIVLGVQQEFVGADFVLQVVPASRVSGAVVAESGTLQGAAVMLVGDDPRGFAPATSYGGRVLEDGTFTIAGVPPGRYIAVARVFGGQRGRGAAGAGPMRGALVGLQSISVAGQDVIGLTIPVSAGGSMAGSVTFESATGQRADVSRLRLSTIPPVRLPFVGSETANIQADLSFTISNVAAGSHLLQVGTLPSGWALKGIYLAGREVTDQPVDVKGGQTVSGLQVALTDQVTTVTGTVVDSQSEPVSDCFVVAFSTNPAAWRPRSRMIQGVRPDDAGVYKMSGLPPGDYYVAAIGDVEPGSWYDPALLEEMSRGASRMSLQEGDAKTVTLKIEGTTQD